MTARLSIAALAVAILAAPLVPTAQTPAKGPALSPSDRLEITAFAVNMSNIATGANASVRIRIDSWTTDAERETLVTTMIEKGANQLLRELQRQPSRGRWNIPGMRQPDPHQLALGHDLRYTRQTALPDGGRRIVIATDRFIGFQEARNRPRSIDYPFTLMQIHVDAQGRGEGKMAVATKINFDRDKKTMELENYASEPVRLQNLRMTVRGS
jgi:hypothetical protein